LDEQYAGYSIKLEISRWCWSLLRGLRNGHA
jgi:hypothetical protein